jgi:hypothetical protein
MHLGQLLERRVDVEACSGRRALEQLEVELVAPVPAAHGAGGQRQLRVRDDARRIEELPPAQAVAARAGAHRVVEREQPRFEFGSAVAADRAGEAAENSSSRLPGPCPARWRGRRPSCSAVSKDSARRCLILARTLRRSTTTSMVCLLFLASFGTASSSCTLPSTRTRTKPCARSSRTGRTCSPLRSLTTGASSMASAACLPAAPAPHRPSARRVCASSGRPWSGQ